MFDYQYFGALHLRILMGKPHNFFIDDVFSKKVVFLKRKYSKRKDFASVISHINLLTRKTRINARKTPSFNLFFVFFVYNFVFFVSNAELLFLPKINL
jgi:hypothetical protein